MKITTKSLKVLCFQLWLGLSIGLLPQAHATENPAHVSVHNHTQRTFQACDIANHYYSPPIIPGMDVLHSLASCPSSCKVTIFLGYCSDMNPVVAIIGVDRYKGIQGIENKFVEGVVVGGTPSSISLNQV